VSVDLTVVTDNVRLIRIVLRIDAGISCLSGEATKRHIALCFYALLKIYVTLKTGGRRVAM
jgi:hypothetical protein